MLGLFRKHVTHSFNLQSELPECTYTHTLRIYGALTVTCELSGKARLSLERVDFGMDGHAVVVPEPVGFTHPLLQSLAHVLLGHMKDTQVRETAKR